MGEQSFLFLSFFLQSSSLCFLNTTNFLILTYCSLTTARCIEQRAVTALPRVNVTADNLYLCRLPNEFSSDQRSGVLAGIRGLRNRPGFRHQPEITRHPKDHGQRGCEPGCEAAEHGGGFKGPGGAHLHGRRAAKLLPGSGDRCQGALPEGWLQAAATSESVEEGQIVREAEARRPCSPWTQQQTHRVFIA